MYVVRSSRAHPTGLSAATPHNNNTQVIDIDGKLNNMDMEGESESVVGENLKQHSENIGKK